METEDDAPAREEVPADIGQPMTIAGWDCFCADEIREQEVAREKKGETDGQEK